MLPAVPWLGIGVGGALRAPTLPACQSEACLGFPEGHVLA